MVAIGLHPEPSAKAPCTMTIFFTPASASGVRAMASTASAIDKVFIFSLAGWGSLTFIGPQQARPSYCTMVLVNQRAPARMSCVRARRSRTGGTWRRRLRNSGHLAQDTREERSYQVSPMRRTFPRVTKRLQSYRRYHRLIDA